MVELSSTQKTKRPRGSNRQEIIGLSACHWATTCACLGSNRSGTAMECIVMADSLNEALFPGFRIPDCGLQIPDQKQIIFAVFYVIYEIHGCIFSGIWDLQSGIRILHARICRIILEAGSAI